MSDIVRSSATESRRGNGLDQAEKTAEPESRTAERASAEQSLASERGSRAVAQPATIRRLQTGLGNAAFARLMTSRRRPALHTHTPALAGNSATQTLFREETEEPVAAPPLLQRAPSAAGAPPPPPPSSPPNQSSPGGTIARDDTEKTGIDKIREINAEKWVDPLDEYALEAEWDKLGAAGAKQYTKDFMTSIDKGMEPDNLKEKDFVMDRFQLVVKGLRDEYLEGNLKDVEKEEKKLGIGEEKPSEAQQANANELVLLAEKAQILNDIVKKYGEIRVGYNDVYSVRGGEARMDERAAHFVPGHPPTHPLKGDEGKGAKAYDDVAASYGQSMGALMAVANKHPSIYLAIKNDQIDSIAGTEGQAAKDPLTAVKTILANGRNAITETKNKDMSWKDLKPIHTQLLRGERGSGDLNFAEPWNREIVKDVLDFDETLNTAKDVGIGLAVACAFIFSEIATAGWATVFWAGVGLTAGGANAVRKLENYEDLKTAAAAGTSQATELVEKGQVSAALLDAIIETAFFFIDGVGIGIKGMKGAAALEIKAAGKLAAEKSANLGALKTLKTMSEAEAATAIKQSMNVVGIKRTAEAAGMSVEELLAKAAGDKVVEAEIKAFIEASAKGVEKGKLPAALRAMIKGEEVTGQSGVKLAAEDVLRQAVDELGVPATLAEVAKEGKGWKEVAALVGPSSEAGKRMKAWRDVLARDLEGYIETLRLPEDKTEKLFQKTGTLDNVTNDLDMSLLGPRSGELKDKAALFLAGRTGFSADAKVLDKMVYIGLFTDPRRMHLFDSFPAIQKTLAERTMKFEEQLIWNDEYYKYLLKSEESAQAKQMAEQIAKEMETLGIGKISGYKPLSERAVAVLSKRQDELHGLIEAAANAKDMKTVEKYIEELSNVQAQINVKEGGGYFSAGGVRKFVTDKEGFPGARAAITATHDLGAAIDQVNKLRKSIAAFEEAAMKPAASRDAAELSKNIKDLAKYGDRFTQASEVVGKKVPNPAAFEQLSKDFKELIDKARSGATGKDLATQAEKVIADVRATTNLFSENHLAIIQALQARAGIQGIGELGPDVIKATRQRYYWLQFQSALLSNMSTAIRAAGIPLQMVELGEEPSEANAEAEGGQKGDFNPPKNNNASPA